MDIPVWLGKEIAKLRSQHALGCAIREAALAEFRARREAAAQLAWAQPAFDLRERVRDDRCLALDLLLYLEGSDVEWTRIEPRIRAIMRPLHSDAVIGRRVRNANLSGRPMKDRPSAALLWDAMQKETAGVRREMSATEAARVVSKRHGLSKSHVLRLTKPFRDRH